MTSYRSDHVTGILDGIGMLEHILYSRMCMFVCQLALQARIAAYESKTTSFSADDRVRELEERVAEQDKRFAIVKERVDADRKAIVVSQHSRVSEYDIASLCMIRFYCFVTKACARRLGAAASVEHRRRKRHTLHAGAVGELAVVTRLRQARPSCACTFSEESCIHRDF